MSTPSVEASHPPTQEDGFLGEYSPAMIVRLTLHRRNKGAVLFRHRNPRNSSPLPDPVAWVTCVDGAVADIEWDDRHQRAQPVWMGSVEDWVRATIAEAGS